MQSVSGAHPSPNLRLGTSVAALLILPHLSPPIPHHRGGGGAQVPPTTAGGRPIPDPGRHTNKGLSRPGFFLTTGTAGCEGPTHPDFFLANPPTHKCPTPRGGGGLDTHPPIHPTTIGKMPYHRQNAFTSTFGADPKSPTMAYPTGGGGGGGGWKPTHPENLTPPPPPVGWDTHSEEH